MLWKHNRQKVKCLRQDNKHRCEKGLCSLPGYISVCVKRCGMYEESRPFSQGFIFQQLFSCFVCGQLKSTKDIILLHRQQLPFIFLEHINFCHVPSV